ncbi:unnamed protein product [Lactuca saligna]|uniref:Uncharacterized protein n=1 Tax=Lactuca saligna TaxID=75948 RepID=A0AA35UKR8_LACSI|nr:unnamed protein product [Lactuca saligna]
MIHILYTSRNGDKGVGIDLSKRSREDSGVVVGKAMSKQIPTTIPMKLIITLSTTTTTTGNISQRYANQSNVQNKGISINEGAGGSSSTLVKSTLHVDPRDKGKCIQVEKTIEEKKKL